MALEHTAVKAVSGPCRPQQYSTWRSGCLIRSKAGAQIRSNTSRVTTTFSDGGCGKIDAIPMVAVMAFDSCI